MPLNSLLLESGTATPIQMPFFRSAKDNISNSIFGIDKIKSLFSTGMLEHNFMLSKFKKFISSLKEDVNTLDLTLRLYEKDYSAMQRIINYSNGAFIERWTTPSAVDNIPNPQKLALFVRALKRTHQMEDFCNMNENSFETVVDGVINKAKYAIKPLFKIQIRFNGD